MRGGPLPSDGLLVGSISVMTRGSRIRISVCCTSYIRQIRRLKKCKVSVLKCRWKLAATGASGIKELVEPSTPTPKSEWGYCLHRAIVQVTYRGDCIRALGTYGLGMAAKVGIEPEQHHYSCVGSELMRRKKKDEERLADFVWKIFIRTGFNAWLANRRR